MSYSARELSLLFALAVCGAPFAAHPARSTDVIPLDTTGPRPTAELRLGKAGPLHVIFDTGAAGSVIFPDVAAAAGLPKLGEILIGGHGGGTPRKGYLSLIESGTLGGVAISNVRVAVVNLDLPLPGISGVASPNIFSGKYVVFELGKSRVVISGDLPQRARSISPVGYSDAGHGQSLPQIEVRLPGKTVAAHMDTGSAYDLILPLAMARELPLMGPLRPLGRPVRMAGSEHAAFEAEISGDVSVGPVTLSNSKTLFVEGFPKPNVGFGTLKKLTIVLDPENRRSWVLDAGP